MSNLKDCLIIQKQSVSNKFIKIKEKNNLTVNNFGSQCKEYPNQDDISASKNYDNEKDNESSDTSNEEQKSSSVKKQYKRYYESVTVFRSVSWSDSSDEDTKKNTQVTSRPLEALGINIFQAKQHHRNNIRVNRSRLNFGNKSSKLLTHRPNKDCELETKETANASKITVKLQCYI